MAGSDPIALRKARISVNSLIRCARSLFSPKVLRQLQLPLPSSLPFTGVEFEPRQSIKYRSNVDIAKLIKLANNELRPSDPPAYVVFFSLLPLGSEERKSTFWSGQYSVSKKT
jgi:hypothetical protein